MKSLSPITSLATLIGLGLILMSAVSSTSAGSEPTERWRFTVFLDDAEIGYHHFSLTAKGGGYVIESEALFEIKFLFFNAYKYRHQSTERWRDDCLLRIDAFTNDNGDSYAVEGLARNEAFVVETQEDRRVLPDCVSTFAYWDREVLKRSDRLLNAQTGEYVEVSLQPLGHETIRVRGESIRAQRYRLDAYERQIDLWYSENGEWLQLESTTGRDQLLRYRLL